MASFLKSYWQTAKSFNRDLRIYLTTHAISGFSLNGIFVVLFSLYLLRLGYDARFIGLAMGLHALVRSVSCLLAGALGVRWSSKKGMILGMLSTVVGLGLLPLVEFAPLAGAPKLWRDGWIILTYMMNAFGSSLYIVNFTPFLMSASKPEQRSHAFSLHSALGPLAGFIGSLAGGFLPGVLAGLLNISLREAAPYRLSIWLAILLTLPTLPMLMAISHDEVGRSSSQRKARGPAPIGIMAILVLVMVMRWAGRGPVTSFFNVYLDQELLTSTALIGVLNAAGQLATVPAALLMPLVAGRFGGFWTLIWASVSMSVGLLPLAFIPHWTAAGLSFMALSCLYGLTSPTITVFSQELVKPEWRPAMSAVMNMSVGLGTALMAFGGGYAVKALGYRNLFLTGAILLTCGALIFWGYFRTPRGEMKKSA
jgi:MFS family permease